MCAPKFWALRIRWSGFEIGARASPTRIRIKAKGELANNAKSMDLWSSLLTFEETHLRFRSMKSAKSALNGCPRFPSFLRRRIYDGIIIVKYYFSPAFIIPFFPTWSFVNNAVGRLTEVETKRAYPSKRAICQLLFSTFPSEKCR